MAEFKINLSNLEKEEYSFQQIMKLLHSIQQELLFLSCSFNFKNSQSAGIKREISGSADRVNTYRINIQNLQHGLMEVLERYEAAENKLTGSAAGFRVIKDISFDSASKNQFFELDIGGDGPIRGLAFVQGSIVGMGTIAGTAGLLSGMGMIGAALYKDGKLLSWLFAKIKGKAAAVKWEVKIAFGTEKNNAYIKGEGTLLEAEIGKIAFEDKNGKEETEYGIQGSVGAEAYVESGTVSGGFTVVDIINDTVRAADAEGNIEYDATAGE